MKTNLINEFLSFIIQIITALFFNDFQPIYHGTSVSIRSMPKKCNLLTTDTYCFRNKSYALFFGFLFGMRP